MSILILGVMQNMTRLSLKPIVRLYDKCLSFGHGIKRCHQQNYFITTPIFYVNAQPHIGHLYSSLLADAAHRFHLLKHRQCLTLFSTGTDEHGLKVQQAATQNNILPQKFCDKVSEKFKSLFDATNISYTDYIRTTEERHVETVQRFFKTLMEKDNIYRGSYSGWYCVSDEAYLTDAQVKEVIGLSGKMMVNIDNGHPVEWNSEENYMFNLPNFQDDLKYWLKDEKRIQPKRFLEELRRWLEDDLVDLSVSRPRNRVNWGIPVPGDNQHIIYVWVDALVNYLTVSGYPDQRLWPPDVQFLGKDILRFHGIYWPALLIAAGLEPPRKLLCHSHWTIKGQKMSKSLGNVVCPFKSLENYTSDGLRYFLLREGTPHSDCNWSDVRLVRQLNAELADSLGNLLNRCTAPSLNPSKELPPLDLCYLQNISLAGQKLIEIISKLPNEVDYHYSNFNYYIGVDAIRKAVHAANYFLQEEKPWELKNMQDRNKLDSILRIALESVRVAGIALQPIVPTLTTQLLDSIGVPPHERSWDYVKDVFSKKNEVYLCNSYKLGPRAKLFSKLKLVAD